MQEEATLIGVRLDIDHDGVDHGAIEQDVAFEPVAADLYRNESHRGGEDDSRLLGDDRNRVVDRRQLDETIERSADRW